MYVYFIVPPTEVSLILPVFQATIPTSSTQCHIPAVKPGIGSVVFRLSIGSDFSVDSSNSDLKSGAPDANTGTVSVTYSPEIMLQRKHNGQQAVCTVVWREETVTSESKNADVRCKCLIRFSAMILTRHDSLSIMQVLCIDISILIIKPMI